MCKETPEQKIRPNNCEHEPKQHDVIDEQYTNNFARNVYYKNDDILPRDAL